MAHSVDHFFNVLTQCFKRTVVLRCLGDIELCVTCIIMAAHVVVLYNLRLWNHVQYYVK